MTSNTFTLPQVPSIVDRDQSHKYLPPSSSTPYIEYGLQSPKYPLKTTSTYLQSPVTIPLYYINLSYPWLILPKIRKKWEQNSIRLFLKKNWKIITQKKIVVEHSAWRPMKKKFSDLLTLSTLFEASTFKKENENHVFLEYVKKSKTYFDFFSNNYSRSCLN